MDQKSKRQKLEDISKLAEMVTDDNILNKDQLKNLDQEVTAAIKELSVPRFFKRLSESPTAGD